MFLNFTFCVVLGLFSFIVLHTWRALSIWKLISFICGKFFYYLIILTSSFLSSLFFQFLLVLCWTPLSNLHVSFFPMSFPITFFVFFILSRRFLRLLCWFFLEIMFLFLSSSVLLFFIRFYFAFIDRISFWVPFRIQVFFWSVTYLFFSRVILFCLFPFPFSLFLFLMLQGFFSVWWLLIVHI